MIIGNPITLGGGGGGYEIPQYAVSFLCLRDFTIQAYNSTPQWDGTLEYSADGKTWTTWTGAMVSSQNGFLALRGTNNTHLANYNLRISSRIRFDTGRYPVLASGNIETLLDWQTVEAGNHPTMAAYCFAYLFASAPIVQGLTLPATSLAEGCYLGLFQGCDMLINAPELPATTLAASCYKSMFMNCTALPSPPVLPATSLQTECYRNMFQGCTGLAELPALPAITLADYCYNRMFIECTSIKLSTAETGSYEYAYRIPTSGTGVDASSALSQMFTGTGGTFVGTPTINTTYYTFNQIVS